MQVGDRWTYETEMLSGDRKHPVVTRWEQEDRIVAIQTIPEGTLVRRKVELLNSTAPPNPLPDYESNILIHNNCIYYLNDSYTYGWDSSRNGLSADFKKDLAANMVLPDICFPMHNAQTWGHPDPAEGRGRDLWTVAGWGKRNTDDPISVAGESWRLEASLGSGDDDYIWFQKGIGVVAKRTYHNGTYGDYQVRLLNFEPASSKP